MADKKDSPNAPKDDRGAPPVPAAQGGESKITVGRVVLFAFAHGALEVIERPARVVRVWTNEMVNLIVDVDGSNDRDLIELHERTQAHERPTISVWRTSVQKGADAKTPEAGTWRFPPRA